ncbi:GNAT family N-acetyltransferase [Marinicella sediminis]|uniref:GNAT family N-acetyltransferase n=1 Tax=Marinicella sediminis TaxID=1792834 RepID=A0ABV7JCC0_9GAMM|nr:GNAT family N-acetyltransferase [Marinicella sediminis]
MKLPNSARLTYELMGPQDAELLYELDQDKEVMRYINGGHMTSREDVEAIFLPRMAQYTNASKGWGLWKVTRQDNQVFIGWILVRPMGFFSDNPQWQNLELGWRFKREAWGLGFGTEAARAVMNALAESGHADCFSALAMPDNNASIAIMKKLGMQYLKTDLYKDPLGDEVVVYYGCQANQA